MNLSLVSGVTKTEKSDFHRFFIAFPFKLGSNVYKQVWVRMVPEVLFGLRDQSLNPIVCQITDDGLRQVVYILP